MKAGPQAVSDGRAVPQFPAVVPNWIGSREVLGTAERMPVLDPSRGAWVADLAAASSDDVALAIATARSTFGAGVWSRRAVSERAAVLRRAAELVHGEREHLARLDTLCSGLPLNGSTRRHVDAAVGWLEYFAARIVGFGGEIFHTVPGALTLVKREPRGVAALFAPWNVPLGLALLKTAAALAAGNSVVLKPSELAPLAILRVARLLEEAGLPPGVLNIVNGPGHVTGVALASLPGTDCVSFTGGAVAGRAVARAAAERHVPCVLELGGKSALLVFADADLEAAVEAAVAGGFRNNGEACLAASRVLLDAAIAEEFTERYVRRVRMLTVGDPFVPGTDLGPLISAADRERVLGFARAAEQDGVTLLHGGSARDDLGPGFYIDPVVAQVVDAQHAIAQDEIFGPFVVLMTFRGEEEAIRIANGTRYGLVAYLWTRDHGRVLRMVERLEAGTVIVNSAMIREPNAPFGGIKASGTGSEGGDWSLRFYTREKSIVLTDGCAP
jgi:acyl-CoA reductase-like NAD-dependent aldehyde dehydrogenase